MEKRWSAARDARHQQSQGRTENDLGQRARGDVRPTTSDVSKFQPRLHWEIAWINGLRRDRRFLRIEAETRSRTPRAQAMPSGRSPRLDEQSLDEELYIARVGDGMSIISSRA